MPIYVEKPSLYFCTCNESTENLLTSADTVHESQHHACEITYGSLRCIYPHAMYMHRGRQLCTVKIVKRIHACRLMSHKFHSIILLDYICIIQSIGTESALLSAKKCGRAVHKGMQNVQSAKTPSHSSSTATNCGKWTLRASAGMIHKLV